ncbi:MAG: hypothetical protein CSA22_09470 [Deltaproteobacteria bacterium]|nr:MAG: hypothetical protein CSA22_09470 [Deltaproteobacteria bacterium]
MVSKIINTGAGIFVARLCQPLLSFLLFGAAARVLSPEIFGSYVLLMGLLMLFQACATLGLVPLFTREISRHSDVSGVWLKSAAVIMLPASLLTWLCFPLAISLLGGTEQARAASWILGASLPFSSGILCLEAVVISLGLSRQIVVQNFFENLLRVTISLTLLAFGFGLFMLMAVYVCTRAVGFLYLFSRAGTVCGMDKRVVIRLLRGIPTYGAMVIGAMLFFKVDILVISVFCGEVEVGIYGSAYRLLALTFLFPDSFVAVLFPGISRACIDNPDHLTELVPQFMRLMLAVELPVCLLLVGGADFFMTRLFGADFKLGAPVLRLLAFVLPFYTINSTLGVLLQADSREKWAMYLVMGAVVINLLLTMPLTYVWGVTGAALGTFVCSIAVSFMHAIALRKALPMLRPFRNLWRLVFATLVAGAGFIFPFLILGANVQPFLIGCIALVLFGAVNTQDMKIVLEMVKKKKRNTQCVS